MFTMLTSRGLAYEIYAYTSLELLDGNDPILDEEVKEWSKEFNVQ